MPTYAENIKKAQLCAKKVNLMKGGHYLERVRPGAFGIDAYSYVPEIAQWYQLSGYLMKQNENTTRESLQRAADEWIHSSITRGNSAAFSLVCHGGKLSVLYGSGYTYTQASFKANVPECDLRKTQRGDFEYSYNGIITGNTKLNSIADVIAMSGVKNAYVSYIIIPISADEVNGKAEENRRLISYLEEHKSFNRVYGNATKRIETIPVREVESAISLLKQENEYFENHMNYGFVRCAIRFGADNYGDYRTLASLITSNVETDRTQKGGIEPARSFELRAGVCRTWADCLAIPNIEIADSSYSGKIYPVSIQDIHSAASFCVPPLNSHDGCYVKNYNINENSLSAFPATEQRYSEGVNLGTISDSSIPAAIPFSSLHSHAFVTGATETGKTTTIKRILTELYSNNIPFTVIEAAKKEYVSLLGSISELKIYTSGIDGEALIFNPLQPEDGVLIEKHVDAVTMAIVASTGGEHPIPEAYEGLLKQTYESYGWKYGMMAYTDDNKPFPTFKDVLDNVDSYIKMHAQYGPEVKQNLTAALTLRSENMHSGALGNLINTHAGLTSAELLETPCVIELADFSTKSAAFIMNIMLFKFQCYLSRKQESRELRRVIVVEEAHNIFRRTISETSGQALSNDYFEKMLSEIRNSGTGLIMSDQRPGIMSDAVIANTSVKIIHALTERNDRDLVGNSTNMSELQMKKLSELQPGECIVSLRGEYGVQKVSVKPAYEKTMHNAACHICSGRFRCRKSAIKNIVDSMDESKINMYISKIQNNPYNTTLLEKNISEMLQALNISASATTKLCFLGEILNKYGTTSYQEKRIITNAYARYLRKERE